MKPKVYLDTSIISAIFDDRNPVRKELSEDFFAQTENFELYISELTLIGTESILIGPESTSEDGEDELRKKVRSKIWTFSVLEINPEAQELAEELIEVGAISQEANEEASHIAIAVVWGMDYFLSWNFRQIVRLKTKDMVRMVTNRRGYKPLNIIVPAELI